MALTEAQQQIVSNEVITTLRKALAPLEFLKKDFRMDYASSLKIRTVSAGNSVTENPTDYQTGDAGTGEVQTIALTELNQSFKIDPADKRNGWRLADLMQANTIVFANDLNKRVLGLLSKAGAKEIGDASAFTKRKCINLSGDIESDEPRLLLTPDYYRAIMPENTTEFRLDQGAYGFESIHRVKPAVFDTGVVGLSYEAGAIAVGSAIPQIDDELRDDLNMSLIQVDGLAGLTVMFCHWLDRTTRSEWGSLGIMFGAKVLEADKVKGYVASAS